MSDPPPPPPSSPLVTQLRQLLSFDSPRVFMGQRWPVIKQEKRDEDLSSDPHFPEEEKDHHHPLATTPSISCSLCTHTPGVKHLSILSFSDSSRDDHLRSLLGVSGSKADFIFCSQCRHVMTRLFQLKEEVQDIEGRIRGVVKLRKVQAGVQGNGNESPDEEPQLTDRSEPSVFADSAKGTHDGRTPGVHPVGPMTAGHAFLKSAHKKDKTLYNGILPPIILPFKRGGRALLRCPQCWKHFTQRARVLSHMSRFHGLNLKHKNFKKMGRRKYCPVCNRGFHNMELFKGHSHTDPEDPTKVIYTCSRCVKTFALPDHLRNHIAQFHLRKYQVTCPTCKKVFQRKQGLLNHSRICSMPLEDIGKDGDTVGSLRGGDGDKSLTSTKCYLCSEVLEDVGSLANHLRIHSLQTPFGV